MISLLRKLVVVLFLVSTISLSRHRFARAEEAEEWEDAENFDDESGGGADPWDNTDDIKPMDGALPASLYAVIHLDSDAVETLPGLREFVQFDLPNYPKLSARGVNQSPPTLRFFESEEAVTIYTISEALKNDAVPEDQLEAVKAIELPPQDIIDSLPLDEVDLTGLDAEEISGILADHNVLREEILVDDDDLDASDEDDAELFGEDGEPVAKKPRRRKKRVDWRSRRASRLEKEAAEAKEKRKAEGAKGGIPGVSLAIPGPILFLIVTGGLGAMGYLGYILLQTQEATLKAEERKKLKSQQKIEKRLKKEAKKTVKKR